MSTLDKLKVFFGLEEEELDNPGQGPRRDEFQTPTIRPFKSATVSVPSVQRHGSFSEIMVEEPRIYEDSLNIATNLREGKPVIVNLKFLDSESGKRLVDFICGTAYALNGHMLKIGETIFLFTPSTIQIAEASEKNNTVVPDQHERGYNSHFGSNFRPNSF